MSQNRQLDLSPDQIRSIRRQLTGPNRGICDERVIQSMTEVPRHLFVPDESRANAYSDGPLSIGYGQTISQPYVVAYMIEALRLTPEDRVLEIGVGSGYQTAVLSRLVKSVYGVEIVEPLASRARENLRQLGIENVSIRVGDGAAGWPEEAPFDAILVACAPEVIPRELVDQLGTGARMILPVGERFETQDLWLVEKHSGGFRKQPVLPVRFVPMTGQAAARST